jgi:hypothetical protein
MLFAVAPGAALKAQTFLTAPINLSATGRAGMPAIAAGPSGEIDVVWIDSSKGILFRRSTDSGKTFSAPITVATTNLPSSASQPQIAVNSGGVYVAWAGPGDIFFSSLASGAGSFSAPTNVSGGKGIASGSSAPVPHMAIDPSGGVDIVWGQSAAWFWRSRDGASVQLTTSAMASQSPRIAINSAGHVFVVWENAGSCPAIMFGRSIDGGSSFNEYSVPDEVTLSNGQRITGCTSDVQIAVGANNTIWLLWANENQAIQDLIITYSIDTDPFTQNSSTIFPEAQFENLSGTASHTPQMAIDSSGSISVAWIGDIKLNDPQDEVAYFSRSTDPQTGGTFCGGPNNAKCTDTPILSTSGAGFPQIVAEPNGAIDVLWQQASATNPSGAYDIVLAHSTDGATFTKSILNNAPTTQTSTGQLAVDTSGNVYAVWQGSSGSGGDILLNGDSAGLTTSGAFSLNGVKATVSPLSAVINVGGSASFSLSLSSTNSVPGTVTLACAGAPSGVSCSFNPDTVSVAANGTASASLKVSVSVKPSASVAQRNPGGLGRWPGSVLPMAAWALALALLSAGLAAAQRARNASQFARVLALMLLVAAATGMLSCGGSTQGGGGGGGSITFPLTLQAQSNGAGTSLQTISVTVP